jgi:hypothetical protein
MKFWVVLVLIKDYLPTTIQNIKNTVYALWKMFNTVSLYAFFFSVLQVTTETLLFELVVSDVSVTVYFPLYDHYI